MAHGKSLEKIEVPEPKLLCNCGEIWESEIHFTKEGKLRKKLDRSKHFGLGNMGGRGAGRRKISLGFSKPSTASMAKGQSKMASCFGPAMPTRQEMRRMDREYAAKKR